MTTAAQESLSNFYKSVKIASPRTAALMHTDIVRVAIFSTAQDPKPAQESAENLRQLAQELPRPLQGVLANALEGLGFKTE